MGGSGNNYGPTYLMDRDVVFVAINYRLASFGKVNTFLFRFIPSSSSKLLIHANISLQVF